MFSGVMDSALVLKKITDLPVSALTFSSLKI
jgi:hypothetical protein